MKEQLQFKSRSDLKIIIKSLEEFLARPVKKGNHPTLYSELLNGEYRTVMGVRICDYKFSIDEKWVLPDEQKGLSFSASWANLKDVHRMVSRGKDEMGNPNSADVYWIPQKTAVPKGMKFVQDKRPKKQGHYFLTITEKMKVSTLVSNLKWIAHRLSIIKDGSRVL